MECATLTISYHQYFLHISKVLNMLHHGSMGRDHSKDKNATLYIYTYTFLAFFCCFSSKNSFSFFQRSVKFPEQNINQSETRIGDKKLSMELYEYKLVPS